MADELATPRVLHDGAPGGPVVLLAHGLEDNWRTWVPLARRFDPAWRVVALDLPWRAGNDYRWRHEALAGRWLQDHVALIGRTPDLVIAHSYGAGAALDLAAKGLLTAGGLVLICPLFRPVADPVTWEVIERSRAGFDRHIRDAVRISLGARVATLEPDVLDSMIALVAERVGPSGFLTALDQFIASGYVDLAAIAAPALFLFGGADPTLVQQAPDVLPGRMREARVLVNPDYDHFCHIRQADAVAREIARFASDTAALAGAAVTDAREGTR